MREPIAFGFGFGILVTSLLLILVSAHSNMTGPGVPHGFTTLLCAFAIVGCIICRLGGGKPDRQYVRVRRNS